LIIIGLQREQSHRLSAYHSLGEVARGVPLSMSRIQSQFLDADSSSRSLTANVFVREEPDDEEDQETPFQEMDAQQLAAKTAWVRLFLREAGKRGYAIEDIDPLLDGPGMTAEILQMRIQGSW
jgi:hypothetical protein